MINTLGGGGSLVGEGSQNGSKAMCEEAGLPHRKQLPLAVSASHPDLTAARNMRPLQTSVLGKRDRTAHIHSEKLLFLPPSHSHSLSQTYKEERKPFVYAHSLIQSQIEIFVSYIHSLFHPHKTIKLSHAWFLFIVCLLNCFISCFSQFGTICLSIFLFLQLPFFAILSCQQHCACSFCERAFLDTVWECFSSPMLLSPPFITAFLGFLSLRAAFLLCSNSDWVEKGIQLPNPGSLYQEC